MISKGSQRAREEIERKVRGRGEREGGEKGEGRREENKMKRDERRQEKEEGERGKSQRLNFTGSAPQLSSLGHFIFSKSIILLRTWLRPTKFTDKAETDRSLLCGGNSSLLCDWPAPHTRNEVVGKPTFPKVTFPVWSESQGTGRIAGPLSPGWDKGWRSHHLPSIPLEPLPNSCSLGRFPAALGPHPSVMTTQHHLGGGVPMGLSGWSQGLL